MQIEDRGEEAIAESGKPPAALPSEPAPKKRRTGKRSDPDFVGVYFSIPKELHRQLDRYVMDLEDEGIVLDRSQVIAKLIEGLTNLSKEVGANDAMLAVMDLHRNHQKRV
jgi:hypothetical protein